MAIPNAPLEQRLDEIVPPPQQREVSAEPDEPIPAFEPAHTGDDNVVQVAGLRNIIIGGAKAVKEGEAARAAAKAAAEAAPPAAKPLEALPQQLQKIEQTIEAAPAAGTPPTTLINQNRIDGPADFKQAVESLATSSGIQVERMTFEQIEAAAKKKGFGQDFLNDIAALKQQYGEIPTDMMWMRLGSYLNAKEFYDLARQAYLNPDNVDMQAQLLYLLNRQNIINEAYILSRTRAAQATAVGRIQISEGRAAGLLDVAEGAKIPGPNDPEMKAILNDPKVVPELKLLVEKFVQLQDEGAREGLLNKVSKTGLIMDLWDRTWKNGLLSGIGTHVVNLTSNTTFLASSVATRALAGLAGSAKRAVGMNAEVELGEAAAMVAGYVHSLREGFSLAGTALRTGTTREMRAGSELISDAGTKLEGQYNIFDARDYGIETEGLVKGINAYANFVTLLGGRPIMAMDEIFKTMGYRAELYAQAYRAEQQVRRAARDAGVPAAEAEQLGLKRMGELLSDPPPELDDLARDFSHMITFSRKLTGSAAQIQELAQENLLGRIVLPFVKTPIWVVSEGMQHSAFAPLSKQWRQDFMAGGAKRELAMAKWGMGTGIMIGAGSLVADGRVTGGGPGDNNLRKVYLDSGWRPYSFVFQSGEWDQDFVKYLRGMRIDPSISKDGRLYVPFRGIDPVGAPMAMIADAVEYARYEDNQDLVGEVLLGATWGLYGYVGQMPFVQGISSLAGAFSATIPNPKQAFKNALDGLAGTAASYAIEGSPVGIFSSARAMVERGVDPFKRMTAESPNTPTVLKGFFEGINRSQARTPILSERLPLTYDYLGEPMTDVDPANPWLASTTGVRYSETKQRPADKIIISLGIPLKKPDMSVTAAGVTIKLEVDEYAYMMQQLGRIADGRGLRLKDAIAERYNTPGFSDDPRNVQQDNIRDVYSGYVKAAQNDLMMNSKFAPAIQRRIETAQIRLPRLGNYAR